MFRKYNILTSFIIIFSITIGSIAYAALPLVAGISLISQTVTRAIAQKAIQRGFVTSDPRVIAISKSVQQALNNKMMQTIGNRETAIALAAITGLTIALNDNRSISLDGENLILNEGSISDSGFYDANGNFISASSLNEMSDFSSLDLSHLSEYNRNAIQEFYNVLNFYKNNGSNVRVDECDQSLCIYVDNAIKYTSQFSPSSGQTQPRSTTFPIDSANTSLPLNVLESPVTDQSIADLTNEIWSEMATTPSYDGVPYQFSNPVTSADIQPIISQNPVTVGDFIAPQPVNRPQSGNPFVEINGSSEPSETTVNQTEYGPDPGISSPLPEEASTISIIDPIFSLLPDFRNFSISEGSGFCPEIRIQALSFDVSTTTHCQMWQIVKPIIHLTMSIVWIFFGIRIILEA